MSSHKSRKLAAAVLSAAMLCNFTVCAWATTTDASSVQKATVIKTALTSDLEVNDQMALPRLLPSETKVKSVGRVLEKDVPLFFDPTEESNVYILLPLDAIVSVIEDLDDWFRVSYNDCTGFIPPEYIELLKYDEAFETYGVVDAEEMSLLKEADGGSEVLATLKDGDRVEVTGLDNGWFAVRSDEGSSEQASTETAAVSSGSGSAVVDFAMQYLGVPYAYGGTSGSGFDCSGFTMYVYSNFGVSLAHGATPQLNNGTAVSQSELQPGDLVFFFGTYNTSSAASHVGIYVGGNQFIHASTSRGVIISSLGESYYANRYLTARRVL